MKAKDRFRSVEPANLDAAIEALSPGETITCDIAPSEYHRRPEISSGFTRCMKSEGPLAAYSKYVARDSVDEDSESMKIGRLVHLALSQPDSWKDSVRIAPQCLEEGESLESIRKAWSGRTKAKLQAGDEIDLRVPAHREWIASLAGDPSVSLVSQGDFDTVCGIAQSVGENPATAVLVNSQEIDREVVGFRRDEKTGLVLKSMADCLLLDESLVVDYKTSSLQTAEKFIRHAIREWGIGVQLAHYARVFQVENAAVVYLRNQKPWEAIWLSMPEWGMRESAAVLDWSLRKILECRELGSWRSDSWGFRASLVLE